MSIIDHAVAANRQYSHRHDPKLALRPAPKIAVVTCMDQRHSKLQDILLLNHTGCGFTTFTDAELNARLAAETDNSLPTPMRFFAYKDPVEHTREQIASVRSHPWIAKQIPVRGFVFDMETGLLTEVHVS